jgi:nitrogen regulatory protein PII
MQIVMFVLDDPEKLDPVLDAWEAIDVTGVTIIESSGINRRRVARQVGTSYMAGFNRLMSGSQTNHHTLFTIVPDEEMVRRCIAAAESIVGDLDDPNTGVLAAWELSVVKGVPPADNQQ